MRRAVYTCTRIGLVVAVIAALGPGLAAFSVVTVPVGINPGALAVNPQTGEINVADSGSNDVSVVDGFTFKVSTVPAGSLPTAIAINRVTGYAYVANSWDNTVTAIYGYGEGKKRKTYTTGAGHSPSKEMPQVTQEEWVTGLDRGPSPAASTSDVQRLAHERR